MVKGVNKTVIEINNTGSRVFEKIVFYVTPQYGNLSPKRLQKATSDFLLRLDDTQAYAPLRTRCKRKRYQKAWLAAALLGAAAIAVLCFVL